MLTNWKISWSTLPYISLSKYVIQISSECSPSIHASAGAFRHRLQISYECPPWVSAPVEDFRHRLRISFKCPHWFLLLSRILGTDCRFHVSVLHKLEESWRTNLRKSSAVPNRPDYNKNHGVQVCEIPLLYLIDRIITKTMECKSLKSLCCT